MNKLIAALLLITIFGFHSKKDRNKDFKIISASMYQTFGGVAGSGSTTIYDISLKARRKINIACDSGYGIGRRDNLYLVSDSGKTMSEKSLRRGEVIHLRFSIHDEALVGGGNFQMYLPGSDSSALPIHSDIGVVIKYRGGKNKALAINKIETKEPIFAP